MSRIDSARNAGHVGQRDDPPTGLARFAHAVRKARSHAARRSLEHRDPAALLLQHVGEGEIAPAHHGHDVGHHSEQVSCRVRGNGYAVRERMEQLVAAEACPGSCGEEHAGDRVLRGRP